MRRKLDFGQGLYGTAELARYVVMYSGGEARMSRVPYWLRNGLSRVQHQRHRPDYGFLELVSLFVVGDLLRAGLKLRQIRTAESYLQKQLGHPRPFATERIYSDGANVFFEAAPSVHDQITAADLEGQEALRGVLKLELKGVGYVDGVASAWRAAPSVVLNPAVQFGEPCIDGTRVQTRQLAKLSALGMAPKALAEDFELPLEEIRAGLKFEDALAAV